MNELYDYYNDLDEDEWEDEDHQLILNDYNTNQCYINEDDTGLVLPNGKTAGHRIKIFNKR